jgi:phosphoglycerate dehydrogenase-like enzyme
VSGAAVPLTAVTVGPGPPSNLLTTTVVANGGALVPGEVAEVAVWERHSGDGFDQFLAGAPSARWVQLPSAGIDWLFDLGLYRAGITWTCAKGAFGDSVAELAVALLLAGFRSLHTFLRAATWLPEGGRQLSGSHVAIVGAGGIATSVLERLRPWRVKTTVVRQRKAPLPLADQVVALDLLPKVLASADAVILAVPLTPATRHLIGVDELAVMRPEAWLVNVGRGELVDTEALVGALRRGAIGGAALDVTDPEPLPDGHPLWSMPNVMITPHVAATAEMSAEPFAERVAENLRRWRTDRELLGTIDPDDGY